jgi:hypothetical protein
MIGLGRCRAIGAAADLVVRALLVVGPDGPLRLRKPVTRGSSGPASASISSVAENRLVELLDHPRVLGSRGASIGLSEDRVNMVATKTGQFGTRIPAKPDRAAAVRRLNSRSQPPRRVQCLRPGSSSRPKMDGVEARRQLPIEQWPRRAPRLGISDRLKRLGGCPRDRLNFLMLMCAPRGAIQSRAVEPRPGPSGY